MIEKMNTHYSMTNPASIYDEEALTALELAGRTTAKVNECVEKCNETETTTRDHLSAQDKTINDRMDAQDKAIPVEVRAEVQNQIEDGTFDRAIDQYAGGLETRLNNLLGSVTQGSTTLDAEVIDTRTTLDGRTYPNAGTAIRVQFNELDGVGHTMAVQSGLNIDTVNNTISTTGQTLLFYGNKRYTLPAFTVNKHEGSATVMLVYNITTESVECIPYQYFEKKDHVVMFIINYNSIAAGVCAFTPYFPFYKVNGVPFSGAELPQFVQGNPFATTNDDKTVIQFDTANKTVTLKDMYIPCGSRRYDTAPCTLSYDTGTGVTTKYIVVDVLGGHTNNKYNVQIIDYNTYKEGAQVMVAQFQTNYLTYPSAHHIPFSGYMVDGVVYSRYATEPQNNGEGLTVYVDGISGNDGHKGGINNPVKTIQKALSLGASVVYVKPGVYKENINVQNMATVKILAQWSGIKNRDRVIITNGTDLTLSSRGDGLLTASYTPSPDSLINDVFIDKTLDAVSVGSRSNGYPVTLWDKTGDISTHTRLTPVLTLEECAETDNSFYYDGENIIINGTGSKYTIVDTQKTNTFANLGELVIEDVVFEHTGGSCATLRNCNNVVVRNCEFNYSNISEGMETIDVNGEFYSCVAHHNRNDGFNLHRCGCTTFYDCVGCYNYDDGISHHDGCVGAVRGGEWHHNGKGGVSSPTHGAVIDVHNIVSHHNSYGIYAGSDTDITDKRPVIISGCALFNNGAGIYTSYDVYSVNNILKENNTDISGSGTVTTL